MAQPDMLLVEDDAALAELVTWHFSREGFEVRHTPNGEEALLWVQEKLPDIVLLDWMVESLSGIEVCRRLRRRPDTANVPIIMLTARGEEEDRVRGLETDADDYVTKPFSPRELVARVNTVLRRPRRQAHGTQPAAPREFGRLRVDAEGRDVWVDDQQVGLTRTEFDILDALSARPNVALSRRQIIDAVWGAGWVGDDHVVDVHVANLRKKLDDPPTEPRYILTVRGVGYRMGAGG